MTHIGNLIKRAVLVFLPAFILSIFASPAPAICAASRAQNVNTDSVIVVIDAGHGGENEGANEYGDPIEKDMTLTTAFAMQRELERYDGVTVYMTRMGDEDMSLAERAAFASSVNADFLFSLHYNASVEHNNFGSEVLVSGETPYNAYGVQFGEIELKLLEEKGFYPRGVKAREGKNGDYYGLIREASSRGIPSVIIEHCYVDQEIDRERCNTDGKQQALGVVDATAVAKYFGLKSSELNVDYSSYAENELFSVDAGKISAATIDNEDAPDEVKISQAGVDVATGEVEIAIHGFDRNDSIIYYCYSTDGGQTYSRYYEWPDSDPLHNENANDFNIKVTLGKGSVNPITVRAINMFDRFTTSNDLVVNWDPDFIAQDGEAGDTNGVGGMGVGNGIDGANGNGGVTADSEQTGQWINDPERLRQQAALNSSADDTLTEESIEGEDSDTKSDGKTSITDRLFPDKKISWLAALIIVFPIISGLLIAGIFIYRMTR